MIFEQLKIPKRIGSSGAFKIKNEILNLATKHDNFHLVILARKTTVNLCKEKARRVAGGDLNM